MGSTLASAAAKFSTMIGVEVEHLQDDHGPEARPAQPVYGRVHQPAVQQQQVKAAEPRQICLMPRAPTNGGQDERRQQEHD